MILLGGKVSRLRPESDVTTTARNVRLDPKVTCPTAALLKNNMDNRGQQFRIVVIVVSVVFLNY